MKTFRQALTCLVLPVAVLTSPRLARADALDNWSATQVVATPPGLQGMVFYGAAYGNGRYVAVGEYVMDDNGLLQTSDDGQHWTDRTPHDYSIFDLYDVSFGNGVFVAVGWDWFSGRNIYHSTNGINWTPHTTSIGSVYRVTYGSGKFVAVGEDTLLNSAGTTSQTIYTSPDGLTWTARSSGAPAEDPQALNDVAYGSGWFYAVDNAHHLYKSNTGSSWSRSTNSAAGNRISFCNDRFIVASAPGLNLMSLNGVNWFTLANTTGALFGRVVYADGCYAALTGTNVFTSLDATNWVERSLHLPGNVSLTAATYGNRRFVLAGYAAGVLNSSPWLPTAYVSDPTVALSINPGFPPQLQLSGIVGKSYRIDQLDSLAGTWQPAATVPLSASPATWTDTQATNSLRFYRAVLLP